MNSRTYQTAHNHTREGGSTWGTAAAAYQEDEPGRVTRHRNKAQDHRFTDKYQEGKAMPGDHVTRHGAPNKGRDEEEQERQGNIHGDFHRGQLARDPTKQGAKKKTRERGRGRRRRGGGDRDHETRHGAPNEGRDEEEQERQGSTHGDFHRG